MAPKFGFLTFARGSTVQQARTEASRAVREAGFNIKASAIKASFSVQRVTQHNLIAVLKATGRPIGLINYGARQTNAGVKVRVKTGSQDLRHAFIATMRSGHRGVMVRAGGKGSPRLPTPRAVWAKHPRSTIQSRGGERHHGQD